MTKKSRWPIAAAAALSVVMLVGCSASQPHEEDGATPAVTISSPEAVALGAAWRSNVEAKIEEGQLSQQLTSDALIWAETFSKLSAAQLQAICDVEETGKPTHPDYVRGAGPYSMSERWYSTRIAAMCGDENVDLPDGPTHDWLTVVDNGPAT